jgi:hypothetical protein
VHACTQGVFTRKVSVLPRPIRPETFAERVPAIDNETSSGIYYALQGAHLLDLKDMLVQDPRCALNLPPFGRKWWKD